MSLFARTARLAATRQVRRMASNEGPSVNLFPAETWPLILCIGGGVVLCIGIQARYTFKSPDIRWSKGNRLDPLREYHVENYGEKFGTHQHSLAKKTGSNAFFTNSKIPTRAQCEPAPAAKLFDDE